MSAVGPLNSLLNATVHRFQDVDFFPLEIWDALNQFQKVQWTEWNPEYSPNVIHEMCVDDGSKRRWHSLSDQPLVLQGRDKKGRPFLIAQVPDFIPIVYYTYSDSKCSRDFQDLKKWTVWSDVEWIQQRGEFTDLDLELLSAIANEKDCRSIRQELNVAHMRVEPAFNPQGYQRLLTDQELFPRQIYNALERLQTVEIVELIPDRAVSISLQEVPKEKPLIQQGLDMIGRPFLLVFIPNFKPLIYFTEVLDPKYFTRYEGWHCNAIGEFILRSVTNQDLVLFSEILKGKDCIETRKSLEKDWETGRPLFI